MSAALFKGHEPPCGSMGHLSMQLHSVKFVENTIERRAFKQHLNLVSRALKAIELNDAGKGDKKENDAIRACLQKGDILYCAIDEANSLIEILQEEVRSLIRNC